MPIAARITDMHPCPIPGHAVNPVVSGSPDVVIGFLPAARVGDTEACGAAIVAGSSNVFINFRPAARMGDPTAHGSKIITGCPTVDIGESSQSFSLKAASASGAPFCEECEKAKKELEKQQLKNDFHPPPDSVTAVDSLRPENTTADLAGISADQRAEAARPGSSPAQVRARKHIAQQFYKQHGVKYYQKRDSTGKPIGPALPHPIPRAEIRSHLNGIDYTKPLVFGPPPALPGDLHQWCTPGFDQGQYYSAAGVTPDQLGIHHSGNFKAGDAEMKKISSHYECAPVGPYLKSTSAAIHDTWSVKGKKYWTNGGGEQFYVPNRHHMKFKKVNP